jgi:glycine cleavage system aminomethyltransferase T
MATSWRFSALADRQRALGSKLEDWNGMGTAWTYSKDVAQDHVAIRTMEIVPPGWATRWLPGIETWGS